MNFILTHKDSFWRAGKIIGLSLILTIIGSAVILYFRTLSDFIYYNHTRILVISVLVLLVMLILQYKHTSILRENERLYEELKRKQAYIDRDMSMARGVQQGLLQGKIPEVEGAKIVAACKPAAKIGGDFYGVKEKKSFVHFFLGDVAGHGISSALVMAIANGLLQELSQSADDPAEIMQNLNLRLTNYLKNTISFVTLFYACYEPRAHQLTYITAGQHPALLYRGGELIDRLQTGGGILGSFAGNTYSAGTIKLLPGDKLIAYTDGFTEARDADGQELGEEFLLKVLQPLINKPLEKIKEGLYSRMNNAVVNDDLSLLCFEAS